MAIMDYDEAATERLETTYLGADVVVQRQETIKRLELNSGDHVIDVGSGPGFLCESMADIVGPNGNIIGVDIYQTMVDRANKRNHRDWLNYSQGDVTYVT